MMAKRRIQEQIEVRTHLNSGYSSIMLPEVVDIMLDTIRLEANIGAFLVQDLAIERLCMTYSALSALVGSQPDEISLYHSMDQCLAAIIEGLNLAPDHRILVTHDLLSSERLHLDQSLRRYAKVDVLETDAHGRVLVPALERELQLGNVGLVIVTHVGVMAQNPVDSIAEACRAAQVPWAVDVSTSLGCFPVSLSADFVFGSGGAYLRGPSHVVFLSSAATPRVASTVTTSSIPAGIGLGLAAEHVLDRTPSDLWEEIRMLVNKLREQLQCIPGIVLLNPAESAPCGVVTFRPVPLGLSGWGGTTKDVYAAVAEAGVHVGLRMTADGDEVLCATPHTFNTCEDLATLCDAVRMAVFPSKVESRLPRSSCSSEDWIELHIPSSSSESFFLEDEEEDRNDDFQEGPPCPLNTVPLVQSPMLRHTMEALDIPTGSSPPDEGVSIYGRTPSPLTIEDIRSSTPPPVRSSRGFAATFPLKISAPHKE